MHYALLVSNCIYDMWKIKVTCVLMTKIVSWIGECVDYPQVENQSLCTEVN